MACTYFKRFRMEVDVSRELPPIPSASDGFRFVPWHRSSVEAHAEAKYRSFRDEIDAQVFPCLGDYMGCLSLMREISSRRGFASSATWLVETTDDADACGTIQGICTTGGCASIQNIGVVPEHRNRGLGVGLILRALHGFQLMGLHRCQLEVTAENEGAIRLYRRLGFRLARTVYKVAEIAYT